MYGSGLHFGRWGLWIVDWAQLEILHQSVRAMLSASAARALDMGCCAES